MATCRPTNSMAFQLNTSSRFKIESRLPLRKQLPSPSPLLVWTPLICCLQLLTLDVLSLLSTLLNLLILRVSKDSLDPYAWEALLVVSRCSMLELLTLKCCYQRVMCTPSKNNVSSMKIYLIPYSVHKPFSLIRPTKEKGF